MCEDPTGVPTTKQPNDHDKSEVLDTKTRPVERHVGWAGALHFLFAITAVARLPLAVRF